MLTRHHFFAYGVSLGWLPRSGCTGHLALGTQFKAKNKLEMWFMMGYFVGDGWTQDCKKKDGILSYEIRFSINTIAAKQTQYTLTNNLI